MRGQISAKPAELSTKSANSPRSISIGRKLQTWGIHKEICEWGVVLGMKSEGDVSKDTARPSTTGRQTLVVGSFQEMMKGIFSQQEL
jgi:hypothetical protein